VVHVSEHLLSKPKALSSNSVLPKKKKKKERKKENLIISELSTKAIA
jgi:hypothetical protein